PYATRLVELQLRLTVAALVLYTGRQHFDGEFWSAGEMPGVVHQCSESLVADPDHIWRDVICFAEENTWGNAGLSHATGKRPGTQLGVEVAAGVLMMPVRLSGHI